MQSAEMQFKEVMLEMSHNCNISCQMCGFGFRYNPVNKEKFMPADNFRRYVDMFAGKTSVLRLNGRGESTIHPNFKELLLWTHRKYPTLQLSLFTNASFNDPALIEVLIACNVLVFVSFDSTKKELLEKIRFGCRYEQVVSNIDRLREHKTRPFIICTLQMDNIEEIEALGHFAFEKNCSIIYNSIRSDDESTIADYHDYIRNHVDEVAASFNHIAELYTDSGLQCLIPDQIGGITINSKGKTTTHGTMSHCPAINNELCILFDGTVTPCNMFNPYVYGNLSTSTLEEILLGAKYANFKKLYKVHYYCKNCANLGV
jgi:MoaA/NifB/PqqE/SkfB family radical SAM enzyme